MDSDLDEHPFRFLDGPVSLATLASNQLSLILWRYQLLTHEKIDSVKRRSCSTDLIMTTFSCTKLISEPLPSCIVDIIDEKIHSMEINLKNWVRFLVLCSSDVQSAFSATFDDIVCDPNGNLSYGKTATEVLKKDDINDNTKFKIACMFCLEDDIRRLWPLVSSNTRIEWHAFSNVMPIKYWYCILTLSTDLVSTENRVLNALRRKNWPALRYFWQCLNDELKVYMTLELFKNKDIDILICILPMLNKSQAREVFEAKACEILSILLSNHEYIEHVLELWTQMENVISEGIFLRLIQGLWKLTWNIDRNDRMQKYNVNGLLMEIWTRSSDQLKSYVLTQHSAKFFNELKSNSPVFYYNYGHDMEFLLLVLRRNTVEFRSSIWQSNWRKIVLRAKPSYLKQFVELCLPDDQTTKDFKSGPMLDYKLLHTLLIRYGFYSDVSEYLKFCLNDDVKETQMAKKIIQNNTGVIIPTLLDAEMFKKFSSFVDGLFSDPSSAIRFKHQLIWSSKGLKALFVMINKNRLKDCQQIIRSFATFEGNLRQMKAQFLNHLSGYLTSVHTSEFIEWNWIELLEWCTENKNEIEIFKKSLDIDAIFKANFDSYAFKSFKREFRPELFFYDRFADWYFDDDKLSLDFRRDKIYNYKENACIRKFYEQMPARFIFSMLKWAFNYDWKKILEYKIYCNPNSGTMTDDSDDQSFDIDDIDGIDGIDDIDDIDDILEERYPFKFIEGPLSLVTLSSTALSLQLWRQKTSPRGTADVASMLDQQFSCTEYVTVPSSIQALVDEKIISMSRELKNWVRFYTKFKFDLRCVFSSNFDDIVGDPNGTIGYANTARKILQRTDIDDKMKLRVACTFCLKEEIEQIWPLVSNDSKFVKTLFSESAMPCYFWGCYMISELPEIGYYRLDSLLMAAFRKRNWVAMRCFWHHLDEDSKVPKVLEFFANNDIDIMLCMLPALNESQAQQVFEAKGCEILSILLQNREYAEHVLALWIHMENVISPKVFLKLICGLWNLTWNIERLNSMRSYKVDWLLMEIWSRAPEDRKTYVLNHYSAEFFKKLKYHSPGFVYNYGHDMEFLLEVMRSILFEFRRPIWVKNWKKIVLRSKPSYLEQFLALCYTDNEELTQFKISKLATYKHFYTLLIRHGFYSDLNDYLNLITLEPGKAKVRAREVLNSNISAVIVGLIYEQKFENFDTFVSGLFTDDATALNEFKAKLVLSDNGLKSLFSLANQGHLEACKRLVNFLLTSEEDLATIKIEFLERAREYVVARQNNDFNGSNFDELIKWLCEDESGMADFKESLNINEIFAVHLKTYAYISWNNPAGERNLGSGKELFFFHSFAKWYFVDDQAIRNFKQERIDNYEQISDIRKIMAEAKTDMIVKMLRWIFDDDAEKVAEFQERLVEDGVRSATD